MAYVHGHAACVTSGCPMHGVNQAECCDGETAGAAPVPTAELAAVPAGSVSMVAGRESAVAPSRR
jgi:hypothetical protein